MEAVNDIAVYHGATRLQVAVDIAGCVHLVPSCTHQRGPEALCDVNVTTLGNGTDFVRACATCRSVYEGGGHHVPRGPVALVRLFDSEVSDSAGESDDPLAVAKQALAGLPEVSLPEVGVLWPIVATESADGLLHADPWCASYDDEAIGREFLVGLSEGGAFAFPDGLHCRRGGPGEQLEAAALAAVRVRDEREHLRRLGSLSGWSLFWSASHLNEECDVTREYANRQLEVGEAGDHVRRLHATNQLYRGLLVDAAGGWDRTVHARRETNVRATALAMTLGVIPGFGTLNAFEVKVNAEQSVVVDMFESFAAGVSLSVLAETKDQLVKQGLPDEVVADLGDCIETFERTLNCNAVRWMQGSLGRIVHVLDGGVLPSDWVVWPSQVLPDGSRYCWLPLPVVRVAQQRYPDWPVLDGVWPEGNAAKFLWG